MLSNSAGLSPSVSSGVVAKVVKANLPSYSQSTLQRNSAYPVMLETTAAVHPGGSGGAVVNLDGHMIGLVTRYFKLSCLKMSKFMLVAKLLAQLSFLFFIFLIGNKETSISESNTYKT